MVAVAAVTTTVAMARARACVPAAGVRARVPVSEYDNIKQRRGEICSSCSFLFCTLFFSLHVFFCFSFFSLSVLLTHSTSLFLSLFFFFSFVHFVPLRWGI